MTKAELVKWIKADITMSGELDITVSDAEIERVIEVETEKIYEIDPEALEEDFIIIHPNLFYTPEFRKNRYIQFPKCVRSVITFEEMRRRNGLFGINDPDISFNRAFQSELWMGSMLNFDTVVYRLGQWSAWDQMKQFTLIDIKHTWNRMSHKLLVTGHDPKVPVMCRMMVDVKAEELYENSWVRKWISAYCKKQVARLLGTFTTNLVGGTTFNVNMYQDMANDDIKDCQEFWKSLQIPTFWLEAY